MGFCYVLLELLEILYTCWTVSTVYPVNIDLDFFITRTIGEDVLNGSRVMGHRVFAKLGRVGKDLPTVDAEVITEGCVKRTRVSILDYGHDIVERF